MSIICYNINIARLYSFYLEREMKNMKFEIGDLVSEVEGNCTFVVVGRVRKTKNLKTPMNFYSVVQVFSLDEDEMLEADLQEYELREKFLMLHVSRSDDTFKEEIEAINEERVGMGFEPIDYQSLLMDYIEYSDATTIDRCLDMINDCDDLYEMFGDKEYLEKKKLVVEGLKRKIKK